MVEVRVDGEVVERRHPGCAEAVGVQQEAARVIGGQAVDAVPFRRELQDIAVCHAGPPLHGRGEGVDFVV
ncbi:hypothetical protein [Streptomyces lancefieldiae]|uniref:Uncharacterized protein n=1 Tax=Streptomyces lancefieldiae TaxID=3075520 RepID=A0ABU3AWN6_9ACTN|nr:hypothetical protein [Streptomyces sp. DSM 40712]MDT0614607.1 hypothetical protein [Streptomyces sp. DSM 40712]